MLCPFLGMEIYSEKSLAPRNLSGINLGTNPRRHRTPGSGVRSSTGKCLVQVVQSSTGKCPVQNLSYKVLQGITLCKICTIK